MHRSLTTIAVAGMFCLLPSTVSAQLQIFIGPNNGDFATASNWAPTGVPSATTLNIVRDNAVAQISSDVTSDSLRTIDGSTINHVSGTLTIETTTGTDVGFWIGEFGADHTYNFSGGVIQINDDLDPPEPMGEGGNEDSFMVGRSTNAEAVFNMTGGQIFCGRLATDDFGNNINRGILHVGLDGVAEWNQSAGSLSALAVQVGRFQSPTADVNLSGTAQWNLEGLILVSDNSAGFPAAISASLNLEGSNVDVECSGLVFGAKSTLGFVADSSGVSTIVCTPLNMAGDVDAHLINAGARLDVDVTSFTGSGPLTLIDGLQSWTGTFQDTNGTELAEGDNVNDDYTITYAGGADGFDVVLEPVTKTLLGDVNCDGVVNLLDVAPFVDLVSNGGFSEKADINQDGLVNLLDVAPFVELLSGG